MIKIERKKRGNKPFYYLSEQVNLNGNFKKIQVYLGKNIPTNLRLFLNKLKDKEISITLSNLKNKEGALDIETTKDIEKTRINFKYLFFSMSSAKKEIFWRKFAIRFIFESNSIEGSHLSQNEVKKIIKKEYIKKTLDRREVQEVINSIKAFNLIISDNFSFNQNEIKKLHKILMNNLGVVGGYKKEEIVVNNKRTISPKDVRKEMTKLLVKYKKEKKYDPFLSAVKFHRSFEYIHPFTDGNGRVGRLILIWMLIKNNHGPILLKDTNKRKYFSALDKADGGRDNKLIRYFVSAYKKTFEEFK